ncbi:hypothetical protein Pan181_50930 [Aeoliella mucimassa]|uniref:Uncharacterized protein n=1 Tax=Aeoliella mucimassa TaxID=2527972 RepID=A0A518AVU9_9BACT|nr:hypothetical protein Pan181_50930 [Aeoliella mucimassa]
MKYQRLAIDSHCENRFPLDAFWEMGIYSSAKIPGFIERAKIQFSHRWVNWESICRALGIYPADAGRCRPGRMGEQQDGMGKFMIGCQAPTGFLLLSGCLDPLLLCATSSDLPPPGRKNEGVGSLREVCWYFRRFFAATPGFGPLLIWGIVGNLRDFAKLSLPIRASVAQASGL